MRKTGSVTRLSGASATDRSPPPRPAKTIVVDHAAVAEFVERYNRCWRLEKLAHRTPLEAREEYELRQAA